MSRRLGVVCLGIGIAAIAALTLVLAACGPSPADDDRRSTLTILHDEAELTFGPQYFTPAKLLLFEPMARRDGEGQLVPRLARAWEHSADFREWTYDLRADARWHDGVPVTSRDVKFTIELFARPEIGYYWDLEEVLTPDDSTVVIRTSRPRGEPDDFTAYYPEHLLGELDPDRIWEWEFWTRPVGNGPYRFARRLPMTFWEFEASPDYYGGRPRIDRIRVRLGGGNPLVELRSGNVDAIASFDRSLLPKIEGDTRFRVHYELLEWSDALWWSHRHPFLGEAAVRRALTHAIDRRELQRVLELPESLPITDVPFYRDMLVDGTLPPAYGFEPARARRLLDDAGWRDRDGDGIRERDGVPAAFTALAGPTSRVPAVYVREALRRVGVRMEIRPLPSPPRSQVQEGDFEAAFDRFSPMQLTWFHGLGYRNQRVRRAIAAVELAAHPAYRDSLMRKLWPDFRRDLPLTLLSPQVHTFVVHERVHGLMSPWAANPFDQAPWLWLEVDR